ncbi:hypothetical protein AXG93_4295s1220 [Marchantia polymorpha subsp. ruderalis]|uniref:Uncharacterized protein n=1 Tax=Marchantia polymorpha subsp. ruderalis TaxID=1480154 RepID=A0A176WAM6_MARPO|nr:hypothetical protein AXG93_4295s1220 [Marchantia polymorpha subsp. ruderalis]
MSASLRESDYTIPNTPVSPAKTRKAQHDGLAAAELVPDIRFPRRGGGAHVDDGSAGRRKPRVRLTDDALTSSKHWMSQKEGQSTGSGSWFCISSCEWQEFGSAPSGYRIALEGTIEKCAEEFAKDDADCGLRMRSWIESPRARAERAQKMRGKNREELRLNQRARGNTRAGRKDAASEECGIRAPTR